jgi:hypothetical protein
MISFYITYMKENSNKTIISICNHVWDGVTMLKKISVQIEKE